MCIKLTLLAPLRSIFSQPKTILFGELKMASSEKFDEAKFLRELVHLKDTQEAIQSLSVFCLKQKKSSAFKMARCWLKVVKKAKLPQKKLNLFYFMNDVAQNAKRKNNAELLGRCQSVLKESASHFNVLDGYIKDKVLRVLNIWSERNIFEAKFIDDLNEAFNKKEAANEKEAKEAVNEDVDNFQPQQLCTSLKIMKALEDDTEYKLKTLKTSKEADLIEDAESLRTTLKDRRHGDDFIGDLEDGRRRLDAYIKALEKETSKRTLVVKALQDASKYYESLLGEAEIVATAYNNFGRRVNNLKKKLEEERLPELVATSISPMPSPPSPSNKDVEMELELPDERQEHKIAVNEPAVDLNSRLDSMMRNRQQATNVSEFLAKLDVPPPPPPMPPPLQSQASYDPVPEWAVEAADDVPLADNDQIYDDNIALARLNKKRPYEEDNTWQQQDTSWQQQKQHPAGTWQQRPNFNEPPPQMFASPPPPPPPPLPQEAPSNNGTGSGNHRPSLQDRLKNLASIPGDSQHDQHGDQSQGQGPWRHQKEGPQPQALPLIQEGPPPPRPPRGGGARGAARGGSYRQAPPPPHISGPRMMRHPGPYPGTRPPFRGRGGGPRPPRRGQGPRW